MTRGERPTPVRTIKDRTSDQIMEYEEEVMRCTAGVLNSETFLVRAGAAYQKILTRLLTGARKNRFVPEDD